ncbi:hypothetical protein HDK77DRAFT_426462 [Phyllosticta capitalensis]|uniref:uncharacterized protein n=1 Tax=Phyllosticta capitalensis TaxID=121624 RepID=UPI003131835E
MAATLCYTSTGVSGTQGASRGGPQMAAYYFNEHPKTSPVVAPTLQQHTGAYPSPRATPQLLQAVPPASAYGHARSDNNSLALNNGQTPQTHNATAPSYDSNAAAETGTFPQLPPSQHQNDKPPPPPFRPPTALEVKIMESQLSAAQGRCTQLERSLMMQKHHNAQLNAHVASHDAERTALQQRVADLEAERRDSIDDTTTNLHIVDQCAGENARLKRKIAACENESTQLKQTIMRLQWAVEQQGQKLVHHEQGGGGCERESENARLKCKLAATEHHNRALMQQSAELTARFRDVESRNRELAAADLSWKVRVACLESDKAELKEQVVELEEKSGVLLKLVGSDTEDILVEEEMNWVVRKRRLGRSDDELEEEGEG